MVKTRDRSYHVPVRILGMSHVFFEEKSLGVGRPEDYKS